MFDIRLGNFIPVIVFLVIIIIGIRLYFRRYKSKDKVLVNLKAIVISFLLLGVFFFIYGLLLPNFAVLASFGYPNTVEDIDTNEELLKYLQRYNDHISEMGRVLSTTFFMLIFFLTSIGVEVYQIFKELNTSRK